LINPGHWANCNLNVLKTLDGFPSKVKFEEATEETKDLNNFEGTFIINYIKERVDSIKKFIHDKNKALDIENRDYNGNVQELLDVKNN
jgi:hypothetical protein